MRPAASEEAAPNERVSILDFWKVYTRPFEILRKFVLDLLHILKFDGISFLKSPKKGLIHIVSEKKR